MKTNIKIFFVFCLFLSGWGNGFAQNLSNRGREFWVGYGHHQFMEPGQSNSQEMVLYFSAEQAANVTVTVRGRTATQVTNYAVPANTVIASNFMPKAGTLDCRLYDVPPSFGGNGGEGVFRMSIHIESDVPIVAYAHTFGSASSGASMLMPVETYGFAYVTINSRQRYANNCFSWAYCIASEDNTVVEIIPSVLTRLAKPASVPFTVTLNKGEVYQIIGANPTNTADALEVSGTSFKSIANTSGDCYPIAVFSGSSRTVNPISCGSGGGDNDNQQCFPTQAWGKRYLTAPTSRSMAANQFMTNSYKVLVKDPTTVVSRNGVPLTGLQQNSFYFFESGTADYIVSDKPVMVAQFMTGGACMGGGVGDPEMMYISPIEQGIKNIGFYRNTRESININYLTLIIPTPGVSSLRIDGSPAFDHSYPHPQLTGYTVVIKRWTSAQAQAKAFSDSAFTAITYGLGSVESYGYNAGTLINNLNAISSIQNTPEPFVPEHSFSCTGTPIKLSVLMAYQPTRIDWLLSQLGTSITPNADVIDNAPVLAGTVVVNGITYYKYSLPGTYVFNAADTFYLSINGYHPSIENCYNREKFKVPVIVKAKPAADFTITGVATAPHSGCTLDPVTLTGVATTSNGYTINSYNWTLPGPTTAMGQTQTLNLPPGVHSINLSLVSSGGCSSDTTLQITIYNKPPGDFSVTPLQLCQGQSFVLNDTSSAAIAVNEWWWDFGNGVTQTVTTGSTVTYTYPSYGTYTIRHVARSSASCVSDTISRVVTVYAKPAVSFSNNAAGCLAPAGLVQFTGLATTPDAQAISTYAWNFGDPNATIPNPNTSNLQNPSHNYQQGTYNITFSATTANGCTKDTVMTVIFNLKPAFNYPALNAICENAAPVSIANANVTNGVTGSGVYSGPGTNTSGMFNPSGAGYGLHTIWYVFTSNANCIDSVSQTIRVNAKPRTGFTIPSSGCLAANGQVQFTNTSTIPDAQTMTWLWNFGDPNANAGNPNTSTLPSPTHNYSEGIYTINLQATSNNGCVKDTSITATFSVTPALNFSPINAICENNAPLSVANAAVTNGVTGLGIYSGPGTNSTGMFDPAVAGYGTHTITYTFTSAGGCVGTTTQNILVNARPRTGFTIPASGCLAANGQVQFTNTSTIPDAQTMTWLWNFGDPNANAGNPNTSTLLSPTHNYSEGTYTINLQATSNNGCIKDTSIIATFSVTPVLNFSAINAVCESNAPLSVANASVTNGVTGTGVYSGPGTSSSGMFNPQMAGYGTHTITYTFTSAGGCVGTTTQNILVNARPRTGFTIPASGCLAANGQVQFTNTSTIPDAQTMTWLWNFGDPNANAGNPNTSTLPSPTHNYSEGTYTINLQATSNNGCVKDTSITATFSVTPVLNFSVINAVCESNAPLSVANATVTNGVTGTGVYSGPGTSSSGMFNPQIAGYGTHTITYTFTSVGGCVETTTQNILVNARPRTGFTIPSSGCLAANGLVQFTNTSSIPDAQTMTWLWNFGDPNANAGNPNTSTVLSPAHNYLEGTFTINLQATSNNGCVKDTSVTATFSVTPALNFGALTNVCQNPGATPTSIAVATVINSVTGTGVYSGPGTSSGGLFDPNIAGPGIHTITYNFTTTGGCTASATSLIEVYPRPTASFAVSGNNGACLGQSVTFTNSSTISSGNISGWNWNLGNGSTPSYGNGNPFNVTYTSPNNYSVQLVAVSNNGCISLPFSQSVRVSPLPIAAFTAPAGICMPGGNAAFVNNSSVTDNSALSYQWNFGDGNSSTVTNPSHVYSAAGTYNVTLIATSAFGCVNQISKNVSDFYNKPIASFTVAPQELCQGQSNIFTDGSSAPNSSVQAWNWDFTDGTFSSVRDPSKIFNTPGTYSVSLVVVNAVGCTSDPFILPVKIYLQPVIDAGRSFVLPLGSVVTLTATSNSSGLNFLWSPAIGLNNPNLLNPELTAMADQIYTLTAVGEFGCTATDMMTVKILKPVKVPNIFTPNGDNIHDQWVIPNLADYPGATVEVFNRYGQQVFYSTGYTPWNGKYKGKQLPAGTYYYIIELQNGFKPLNGSVTLVR